MSWSNLEVALPDFNAESIRMPRLSISGGKQAEAVSRR
jgi:hypothetical protein